MEVNTTTVGLAILCYLCIGLIAALLHIKFAIKVTEEGVLAALLVWPVFALVGGFIALFFAGLEFSAFLILTFGKGRPDIEDHFDSLNQGD